MHKIDDKAFTLVELMIGVAISIVIATAIGSVYIAQQKIYLAQEQVAEMQQNLRAAADLIAREIRMAGYDSTGKAGAGVTTALVGQFGFSQDNNDDGDTADTNEIIDLGFSDQAGSDVGRDGIPDTVINGVPNAIFFGRRTGGAVGTYQAIAENIQAIEFVYILADGTRTSAPTAAQLADLHAVQVSILARASQPDPGILNTMVYCPGSNPLDLATGQCVAPAPAPIWGAYNDNFRRRLLITTVQCRNIGI